MTYSLSMKILYSIKKLVDYVSDFIRIGYLHVSQWFMWEHFHYKIACSFISFKVKGFIVNNRWVAEFLDLIEILFKKDNMLYFKFQFFYCVLLLSLFMPTFINPSVSSKANKFVHLIFFLKMLLLLELLQAVCSWLTCWFIINLIRYYFGFLLILCFTVGFLMLNKFCLKT